jgi:hypothetical protein
MMFSFISYSRVSSTYEEREKEKGMSPYISDVQRLREQIALEIQAMHTGFQGIAVGVAKHQFIEARMHRIGEYEDQLAEHLGREQVGLMRSQKERDKSSKAA